MANIYYLFVERLQRNTVPDFDVRDAFTELRNHTRAFVTEQDWFFRVCFGDCSFP
jgi:hypothetical protein